MLFRKNQNTRSSSPTASDGAKQEIAGHLRLADKHIREGRYVKAKEELDAVRAAEPNNVYALALEERRQALENAAIKEEQRKSLPAEEEAQEQKAQEPTQPQVDEAAIRAEIEQRLESEYNKKFTDEIRKAEQRIAEALKKEREWQEAERSSLIANLEKEKEKFKRELEKQSKEKVDNEIGKMEASFRQQLTAERKKAEEETRTEMSSLYEKSMLELKEAAVREKRGLLEKERKAIEDSRKQIEGDFEKQLSAELANVKASAIAEQEKEREKLIESTRLRMQKEFEEKLQADKKRIEEQHKSKQSDLEKSYDERYKKLEGDFEKQLAAELAKVKASTISEQEKERDELIEVTRLRLQKEFEDKLQADKNRIEEQHKSQQSDIERSYEERYKKLEAETQAELMKRLEEIKENERKEFERKQNELRKQLEVGYQVKLAAELAAEREKIEKRIEKELKEHQTRFETDRKKVVEEEQHKLDEASTVMKAEMQREIDMRVAEAKSSVEASYEEKLKLLGVRFPDTREEKLRIYTARLREAWSTPPITAEVARELMRLRDVLDLSFEDHLECEGEVRLQVYVTEVEKEIRKGNVKSGDESILETIKRKYQITPEESAGFESHILAAFQRAVMKAVILVVDDELPFLDTVRPVLEGYGYSVLTKQSPSEALKLLETTHVDMIISDVMFSGTEGDGFSFYERVQRIPHLRKAPFIIMSGMRESFFVRTGIQLGVDDYLTKPVDPDMLAAVVEGKLKKYRSFRED